MLIRIFKLTQPMGQFWVQFNTFSALDDGGHDWDRTSDPCDVNTVLYR